MTGMLVTGKYARAGKEIASQMIGRQEKLAKTHPGLGVALLLVLHALYVLSNA